MWLSEFGDAQDSGYANVTMQKCLRKFTTKNKIGWAHWALAGSYRIRQDVVFYNDTLGLDQPDLDRIPEQRSRRQLFPSMDPRYGYGEF